MSWTELLEYKRDSSRDRASAHGEQLRPEVAKPRHLGRRIHKDLCCETVV